jgi:Kef-type K+ transport system membrane component KefB
VAPDHDAERVAVNAILLLMGLLVLSYLGSFLVGGRTVRGAGLPSGVEYVALGFVLGPQALDLVGGDMLASFEPVVQVALGWLAFAVGLDFAYAGHRRVRAGSMALATLSVVLTGGAVTGVTWVVVRHLHVGATLDDQILLAGGIGVACSETTRHAVRWVLERHAARGPLAERLNEIANTEDLLPLLAVAVLFALVPATHLPTRIPLLDWPAITVGLGLLLGAGAALLVRSELKLDETWAILFGVSLIAIGTTARLGLSTLTASFFAGLAVSLLSRHGKELRAMVAPTERPVLLPALLLAGAHLDFHSDPKLPWIAGLAIAARLVAKIVFGWVLAATSKPARKAGSLVGLSLMSSGALAVGIGLAFALRFPGVVGDTVLVVAALSATVGEFVGPVRLRNALHRAGEIEAAVSTPQKAPA